METVNTTAATVFIGLDIHKKNWAVHIRTDLFEHKAMNIPPNPEVLYKYVNEHFPQYAVKLSYEIGCCGFHTARYFANLGWQVIVVNPSDIPTSDKQYYQKNDIADCRNISKQLSANQLHGIYIPDEKQDSMKSLFRQRYEMSKQLRSVKCRIKSMLLYHGVVIPEKFDKSIWSKAFLAWLKQIPWAHKPAATAMQSNLDFYEMIYQQYCHIANELRAYCREHYRQDYYLLKSIPGIGGYLASVVLADVGDLRRFTSEAQFASYVGLIPMMRNSGGKDQIFGITPRCRSILRSYIIESAWVAVRKDPELQQYYRQHQGKNSKSIIVKIARKMLNRMLSVIKNNTPYEINYGLKKTANRLQNIGGGASTSPSR